MGRPERQTHNYIRHGTVDLFARALNVATGQVVAQTKKQHRSRDFVSFLREIDERVDPTLTVHVILDNLSAHKSPLVKRWVARHPRFQFHFTPTYSAWLNLVERFFGLLTEHALKRGSPRTRCATPSPPTWTPTMTRASLSSGRKQPTLAKVAVRTAHRSSPRWPQMTNDFLKKSKIKGTSSPW